MNEKELLTALRADPDHDIAILRIAEADFGCEERSEPMLWVQFMLPNGSCGSMELPESRVNALGIAEGSLSRLQDLTARR